MKKPIVISETGHRIYDDEGHRLVDIVFDSGNSMRCAQCYAELEKPKKGSLVQCPECGATFQYSMEPME